MYSKKLLVLKIPSGTLYYVALVRTDVLENRLESIPEDSVLRPLTVSLHGEAE
jgi:hypothetical protein